MRDAATADNKNTYCRYQENMSLKWPLDDSQTRNKNSILYSQVLNCR